MVKLLIVLLAFTVNLSMIAAQDGSPLDQFDADIAKLREQAKAKKHEIDLEFSLEAAKLKEQLNANLESRRVEAMKADKLDDAVRIRDLQDEVANMKVSVETQPTYAVKDGFPEGLFESRWANGNTDIRRFTRRTCVLERVTYKSGITEEKKSEPMRLTKVDGELVWTDDGYRTVFTLCQDVIFVRRYLNGDLLDFAVSVPSPK